MKVRGFILIIFSFLLLSCISDKAEEITIDKLPLYGVGPQSNTFYIGSNKEFHYFSWAYGDESGEYKVKRSEVQLESFSKGSGRTFIHRTQDGKIGLGMSPFNPSEKVEPIEE